MTLDHAHKRNENPRGKWASITSWVNGEHVTDQAPLSAGDIITLKEGDPSVQDVQIEVRPSENPEQPTSPSRPWWRFW